MLEIKSVENEFYLTEGERGFNCVITEQTNVSFGSEPALNIITKNIRDFTKILSEFEDLELRIWRVKFPTFLSKKGINLTIEFVNDEDWLLEFKIYFSTNWRHDFLIDQYITEFARIKGSKFFDVEFVGEPGNWKSVEFFASTNRGENPYDLFLNTEKVVYKYHYNAINILNVEHIDNALKISLEFPEQVKSSSEQYLLYFAQFLQDLGINATSNLQEEAGKVLFSVTPTDDIEALDKIREALAIYLNLPASPIVYDESFAAMRLQQQIENLQHSQKMAASEMRMAGREMLLAQTVIEQQDSLIRQKDSVIEQQNKVIEKIISPTLMMDSLVDNDKEELEKIYDGLEAGHSKWLFELTGIKANLFKVIKTAVKNTLGKDDEDKSILDLDGKE